jgi:hypothetical protein
VSILAPQHPVAGGEGSDAALKLIRQEAGMGKLMVALMRFLPLCAVLLVLFSPILAENALAALITAEPTQGPAGTQVIVRGSAWPPGDLIKLSWNFPPFVTVATARTDGNGAFTATITVPQNAPIGPTEVNAINEAGNRTWQAPFTVTAGQGQLPPEIVHVETFREGVLVFFRVFYTDPNNDAEGFGFVGANGSPWALEIHPFSSPSYGRVYPGRIEYPFNHACGTPSQYESDVAVAIYDRAGLFSQVVTVHLACTKSGQLPTITLVGDNPFYITQGCPFIDPGATAIDAQGRDLTKQITITGSVNINAPGQYLLTYTVTDSGGFRMQKQDR